MNKNGLAKHYGALSPDERFRMVLAAQARDDDTEIDRLIQAGRRRHFSVYDTTGLVLGVSAALNWLFSKRLGCALYLALAQLDAESKSTKAKRKEAERTSDMTTAAAYLLATFAEAARRFAEEVGASPLVKDGTTFEALAPCPVLTALEESVAGIAFDENELRACFGQTADGKEPMTVDTILSEARGIRDFFVKQWS